MRGAIDTSIVFQNNFSLGQITPLLLANTEFDAYSRGLRTATNVLTIPQAGLTRRFGTSFIADITNNTTSDKIKISVLSYDINTQYVIVFYENNIDIYENNTLVKNLTSTYTEDQIADLKYAQQNKRLVIVHGQHIPRILTRGSSSSVWSLSDAVFKNYPTSILDADYSTIKFTPSGAGPGTIIITASSNIFTSIMKGGLIYMNGGIIRIDNYISATQVSGPTIPGYSLTSTSSNPGLLCTIRVPVFSNTLGWPTQITFFQERLILAGTSTYPAGIYASVTNDYFNFDDSTADQDTNAVTTTIANEKGGTVNGLIGANTLMAFSNSGIFTTQNSVDSPLTPTNGGFAAQSSLPIANVRPVFIDEFVLVVNQGGKMINGIQFDVNVQNFEIRDLTVITDVINNPVDMAVLNAPTKNNIQLALIINSDGTLAAFTSLAEQKIQAWTKHITEGLFKQVVSDGKNVWFMIERTIDGNTKIYLEKLSEDILLDCQIVKTYGSPTTTITGLTYLEGKNISVIADNRRYTDLTVDGGQITLDSGAENVNIGLNFEPKIIPMPPVSSSELLYKNRKVQKFIVDYYNSYGIKVNDQLLTQFTLPLDLSASPIAKSGFESVVPFGSSNSAIDGWDPYGEIVITQPEPYPLTIRAFAQQIDNSQNISPGA